MYGHINLIKSQSKEFQNYCKRIVFLFEFMNYFLTINTIGTYKNDLV